jgi:microcin C transport system substrate-binding protein
MQSRQPRALALSRDNDDRMRRRSLKISLLALIALMWTTGLAFAQADENVTVTHAVSNFGDAKYPEGFERLDYVNPDAPKGGEISLWSQGNFDSFNIYTRRGVPGALTQLMYESILANTADDAYGAYCYLCTTMEFPENRDWVIFNLRDDVTFSDGTPLTAEDIEFTFELFMEQGITEYRNVVQGFVESVEVLDPTGSGSTSPKRPRAATC